MTVTAPPAQQPAATVSPASPITFNSAVPAIPAVQMAISAQLSEDCKFVPVVPQAVKLVSPAQPPASLAMDSSICKIRPVWIVVQVGFI